MKFIEVIQITAPLSDGEDFKSCLVTLNVDSIREFFGIDRKVTSGGKCYNAEFTRIRVREYEGTESIMNEGDDKYWYEIAEPYDSFFQRLIIDEDSVAPTLDMIVSLWEK